MIKIHNVRLGLATNSSSSHSFIYIPNTTHAEEFDNTDYSNEVYEGEFGWDDFTLDNAYDKRGYLAVVLSDALRSIQMPKEIRNLTLKAFAGISASDNSYIDHQSSIALPLNFHNQHFLDMEFFEDFRDFILKPGMVIIGGNDNDDARHYLQEEYPDAPNFKFPFTDVFSGLVARKDKNNGTWTLFNKGTGAKIRFSFDDFLQNPLNERATYLRNSQFRYNHSIEWMQKEDFEEIKGLNNINKAFAPELIDISITGYCPFGCEMCYMGSTKDGKHADTGIVFNFLEAASNFKVFEVAFGGGEPTMHPRFVDILKRARSLGIVPNFTTRNLAWLKNPELAKDIIDNMGAFAYSVHTINDIKKLNALVDYVDLPHNKVNLHVVMGTVSQYTFNRILQEAHKYDFRVTLLGYKTSGFGEEYKKDKFEDYQWWLTDIVELRKKEECPQISIDTVLANEYRQALIDLQIPPYMYYTEDGKFSAYFDAVNLRFGAASYLDKDKMIQLEKQRVGYRGQLEDKYYSADDFEELILKHYKDF